MSLRVPIQVSDTGYIDLIILTDRNIERIKEKDPFEVSILGYEGTHIESLKREAIFVTHADKEDVEWITKNHLTATPQEVYERFVKIQDRDDDGPHSIKIWAFIKTMSHDELINKALWEEARAYHKYGVYPDPLLAWQGTFRCWIRRKLEKEFQLNLNRQNPWKQQPDHKPKPTL